MQSAATAIYNSAISGEIPINISSRGSIYAKIYCSDKVSENGSYFYIGRDIMVNNENINFSPILFPDGTYYNDGTYQCFSLSQSNENSNGHVLTANKDCNLDFISIGCGGSGGVPIDGGVRCNTSGGGAGATIIGTISLKQNDVLYAKVDYSKGYDTIQYIGTAVPSIDKSYLGDGGATIITGNVNGKEFTLTSNGGKSGKATRDVNITLNGGDSGIASLSGDYSESVKNIEIFNNPPGGMCRYNHNEDNSAGMASGMQYETTKESKYNKTVIFGKDYLLPSGGGGGGGNSDFLSPYNYFPVNYSYQGKDISQYKAGIGMTGGGFGNRLLTNPNDTTFMSKKNAWLPGGGGGGAQQESRGDTNKCGVGGKGIVICIIRY